MRALLIWPKFVSSFYSYEHVMHLSSKKAVFPPLGLMTVAGILPADWQFRLVDCNAYALTEADWQWAEMVLISGLITQKSHQFQLIAESKRRGIPVAVGGPCATSIPEETQAAGADFLVLDEGEVTIPKFLKALAAGQTSGVFRAEGERPDMTKSPMPRFDLVATKDYFQMMIQFSRGCPFLCEFCDIPVLFGKRPRTKTPEQVLAELQRLYDGGFRGTITIADDNFIAHKKNAVPLLEALAAWQKPRGYPFGLATEASLNLGDDHKLMALMRDAGFKSLFMGVETPDEDTLQRINKKQNVRHDMRDRIHNIYTYGFRVVCGIILGFDGEKKGADKRILKFLEDTSIPLVILNMLYALPQTVLTKRLTKQGRLLNSGNLDGVNLSNFVPTRPLQEVAEEYLSTLDLIVEPVGFLKRLHSNCLMMGPKASGKPKMLSDPKDIYALFTLIWRHGILRRSRFRFWRYGIDILRKNPRAIRRYLIYCLEYEHLKAYAVDIRARLVNHLNQMGQVKHQIFEDKPSTQEPLAV